MSQPVEEEVGPGLQEGLVLSLLTDGVFTMKRQPFKTTFTRSEGPWGSLASTRLLTSTTSGWTISFR